MRKRVFIIAGLILVAAGVIAGLYWRFSPVKNVGLLIPVVLRPKTLSKYSFPNLQKAEFAGSEIKLEKVIERQNGYTSWLFSYTSDGKKITGMLNIPGDMKDTTIRGYKDTGKWPVIVMLRGYADEDIYFTGLGTRKAAGVFAQNGFITLAPDFLGFAGSDSASADILENRFYRPVEALSLLSSIKSLSQADTDHIFFWGHSNGGQIAISVLEILGDKGVPATLWAPVTTGFPESVLQYIGELDDKGIKVKRAINDFMLVYDAKEFSISNYLADITSPIQIHQGGTDVLVKTEQTDRFVGELRGLGKDVDYFRYPRSDHNMSKDWNLVIKRDMEFFKSQLKSPAL